MDDQGDLRQAQDGAGRQWPRPAADLANAMQLHQDLAAALQAAGKAEEALTHYIASGDLALKYPPDGVAALMHTAMHRPGRLP